MAVVFADDDECIWDIIVSICEESSKWARAGAFFTDCKYVLDRALVVSSLLEEKTPSESLTHKNKIHHQSLDDLLFFLLELATSTLLLLLLSQTLWSANVKKLWMSILIPLMSPPPSPGQIHPPVRRPPRRPMIGDVYGGEKPGMTNKGWTLEWRGSASRGSVCSVDPGGHSPSARGVVSYWWHCCWFQCEGGRRSPTTIPLVK